MPATHTDTVLSRLLASRDWLLADGAMATSLYDMGLVRGMAPEMWNLDRPECVLTVHKDSIAAGADILLTNSSGGTSARLKPIGAKGQVFEINKTAAALARQAADATTHPVVVAGTMGPTGEILAPMGTLSHEAAVEMFFDQAQALKAGGVNIAWIETMSSLEELTAAAKGASEAGLAWVGTMSFDTGGATMMGVTPAQLSALVENMAPPPLAYGANCGAGPSAVVRSVLDLTARAPECPIVAKANAGLPRVIEDKLRYDVTRETMADYALLARDAGAQIIGGCCGTSPAHLKAMKQALESTPKGPRPTLEQVVARLGPFSAKADSAEDAF
ncbi:betaine--homocysteine S-methyltransferase [Celeribacter sp. PS-C1]|uniref:betaine--homocysteine S-methyltransferase n=1 Tax=Celeribacter sp. PS-C1 TaxID=2820813 RepID=UPI001CA4ED68|nr:betaine--homocysteine S-methyltransferase [Celeribacter sp. PS-C1]MBW6417679.1 betaine--homocysteine S-methyltransferase [Celeribacter sp. PS-C1]